MNAGITSDNNWSKPIIISIEEVDETIEFIYKQTSNICFTTFPSTSPEPRISKVIFSCKDGKWNKSEPIYGKIIPAKDETYDFDNN